jgi:hypothetical protein
MGKLTISMAIFNSELLIYQRVKFQSPIIVIYGYNICNHRAFNMF